MLCFINYANEQQLKIYIVGPFFYELCPGRFLFTVNMLMNNSIKHIPGPVVFVFIVNMLMNNSIKHIYLGPLCFSEILTWPVCIHCKDVIDQQHRDLLMMAKFIFTIMDHYTHVDG